VPTWIGNLAFYAEVIPAHVETGKSLTIQEDGMRSISELEQKLVAGGDEGDFNPSTISNGFGGNGWEGSGAWGVMSGSTQAMSMPTVVVSANSPPSCAPGEFMKEGAKGAITGGVVAWWTGVGVIAAAVVGAAAGIVGQSVACGYDLLTSEK
jgi:hypothetical protein